MSRAAIGIGSNLGDPPANVRRAIASLGRVGALVAHSRLYRTRPWGKSEQPLFCNAAAIVETRLTPHDLLAALKGIERDLGREPGERWGARVIDLDILLYGDLRVDEPDLQIPHPRLRERAFALIPLAEVDPLYAQAAAHLPASERGGVFPWDRGETVALMSGQPLVERVRVLAKAFLETDLVRLRIEDASRDAIELRRRAPGRTPAASPEAPAAPSPQPRQVEPIAADLVGIFHFVRPAVHEGEALFADRDLGYVEALGIRNPVRSRGGGRVASVLARDGQPVEYGQVLFEIDRL